MYSARSPLPSRLLPASFPHHSSSCTFEHLPLSYSPTFRRWPLCSSLVEGARGKSHHNVVSGFLPADVAVVWAGSQWSLWIIPICGRCHEIDYPISLSHFSVIALLFVWSMQYFFTLAVFPIFLLIYSHTTTDGNRHQPTPCQAGPSASRPLPPTAWCSSN